MLALLGYLFRHLDAVRYDVLSRNGSGRLRALCWFEELQMFRHFAVIVTHETYLGGLCYGSCRCDTFGRHGLN